MRAAAVVRGANGNWPQIALLVPQREREPGNNIHWAANSIHSPSLARNRQPSSALSSTHTKSWPEKLNKVWVWWVGGDARLHVELSLHESDWKVGSWIWSEDLMQMTRPSERIKPSEFLLTDSRDTRNICIFLWLMANSKRALNEHSLSRQLLPKSAHRQRGKIGQELLMTWTPRF